MIPGVGAQPKKKGSVVFTDYSISYQSFVSVKTK